VEERKKARKKESMICVSCVVIVVSSKREGRVGQGREERSIDDSIIVER